MVHKNSLYNLEGRHSANAFAGLNDIVDFNGTIYADKDGFFRGLADGDDNDDNLNKIVGYAIHEKFTSHLIFITLDNLYSNNIKRVYSLINTTRSSFMQNTKAPETFDGQYIGSWFYMGLGFFNSEYIKPEFYRDRDMFMKFVRNIESKQGLGGYADVKLKKFNSENLSINSENLLVVSRHQ